MRQKTRKNNGKGDSELAPSRFASILTERPSGKTKQVTNWSVSSFKGKLKFFRDKIVEYETLLFIFSLVISHFPYFKFVTLTKN